MPEQIDGISVRGFYLLLYLIARKTLLLSRLKCNQVFNRDSEKLSNPLSCNSMFEIFLSFKLFKNMDRLDDKLQLTIPLFVRPKQSNKIKYNSLLWEVKHSIVIRYVCSLCAFKWLKGTFSQHWCIRTQKYYR